jgi:hypothetical protein
MSASTLTTPARHEGANGPADRAHIATHDGSRVALCGENLFGGVPAPPMTERCAACAVPGRVHGMWPGANIFPRS